MQLDLRLVDFKEEADLHAQLASFFGFPAFYGANIHALIDCWSSLRYEEDGMSNIHLGLEEQLILQLSAYDSPSGKRWLFLLLDAVAAVNERAKEEGQVPLIYLLF